MDVFKPATLSAQSLCALLYTCGLIRRPIRRDFHSLSGSRWNGRHQCALSASTPYAQKRCWSEPGSRRNEKMGRRAATEAGRRATKSEKRRRDDRNW